MTTETSIVASFERVIVHQIKKLGTGSSAKSAATFHISCDLKQFFDTLDNHHDQMAFITALSRIAEHPYRYNYEYKEAYAKIMRWLTFGLSGYSYGGKTADMHRLLAKACLFSMTYKTFNEKFRTAKSILDRGGLKKQIAIDYAVEALARVIQTPNETISIEEKIKCVDKALRNPRLWFSLSLGVNLSWELTDKHWAQLLKAAKTDSTNAITNLINKKLNARAKIWRFFNFGKTIPNIEAIQTTASSTSTDTDEDETEIPGTSTLSKALAELEKRPFSKRKELFTNYKAARKAHIDKEKERAQKAIRDKEEQARTETEEAKGKREEEARELSTLKEETARQKDTLTTTEKRIRKTTTRNKTINIRKNSCDFVANRITQT